MENNKTYKGTDKEDYTNSLLMRQSKWWKRILNVQYPYKRNINRLQPGFVLDIGCGVGRNLLHLNGNGVGIDHNETSVATCRSKGLLAFTNAEFKQTEYYKSGRFDSILLAHVAEHMNIEQATELLNSYKHLVKKGGKIIVITPQEAGFRSDDTHVAFMDFKKVSNIFSDIGCQVVKQYSFPFPRMVGNIFKYNEFVSIAQKID